MTLADDAFPATVAAFRANTNKDEFDTANPLKIETAAAIVTVDDKLPYPVTLKRLSVMAICDTLASDVSFDDIIDARDTLNIIPLANTGNAYTAIP